MVRAWVVCAALLLFPLQLMLDATRPESPEVVQTLPPPSVLPVLASGHRETVADLLELKAVVFALTTMNPGEAFSDQDRDHLFLLYRGILALDPDNVDAAIRGSVLLSAFGWRSDASVSLLELARGEAYEFRGKTLEPPRGANLAHPNYWRLYYDEAGIYISLRANEVQSEEERQAWIRRAGRSWVAAADAGGPPALRGVGEALARRGLDEQGILERELESWRIRLHSAPEELLPKIERRIAALETRLHARSLSKWAAGFERRGQRITKLEDLSPPVPAEHLQAPFGTLRVYEGRVIAPEAEAELVRLALSQALTSWVARQPERRPTLVDLGWLVPPYAPPLRWNPLFCQFGWAPARPLEALKLRNRSQILETPFWWELMPGPPPESNALGLQPMPYLSYSIERAEAPAGEGEDASGERPLEVVVRVRPFED